MKKLALLMCAFLGAIGWISASGSDATVYDIAITDGRVVDPETGLDAIRNVGIIGDRIAIVTQDGITGTSSIDANGLIVAPGFIDLHAHGQRIPAARMQAMDGVTTGLELEVGVLPVADFYATAAEEGRPIHYGVAASWAHARVAEIEQVEPRADIEWFTEHFGSTEWQTKIATPKEQASILARIQEGLDQGALGIGFALGYAPHTGRKEYYAGNALAAENSVPTFTHARFLSVTEPDSSFEGFQEMVAVAASTGAHMHVCHLNSLSLRDIGDIAPMIAGAQRNGVNLTVEAYPYGAGATAIGAAMFREPGWQMRLGGIRKSDFTIDGQPLTDERFDDLQTNAPETGVVLHMLHPNERPEDQAALDQSMLFPGGVIASDGGFWTDANGLIANDVWPLPSDAHSHPRAAGTFSRFLRIYVRERQELTLMEAIEKISTGPAEILADAVPQMGRKGRIQIGADADLVLFDLERIGDRATFEQPAQTSVGVEFVIVGGSMLVENGELNTSVMSGQAIRREPTGR